jgi:hypothetical protein
MCELELEVSGKQRMRQFLDVEFDRHPSVMLTFYNLGLEVERPFVSNPRAISVFERALEYSAATSRSPLLWLMYMQAYVVSGQTSSAKTVFLRAINAVPWNKTVWLYGLEFTKHALNAKERAALIDVMRDKGLAIRVDMFEIQMEAAVKR